MKLDAKTISALKESGLMTDDELYPDSTWTAAERKWKEEKLAMALALLEGRASSAWEVARHEYLCKKFNMRGFQFENFRVPEESPEPDKPKMNKAGFSKYDKDRDDFLTSKYGGLSLASVVAGRLLAVEVKL